MLSLKTKITFSFALLIFMLIVAGLMSLSEFKKVSSSADQTIKNHYASIEQSKSILESLEHENTGLLMFWLEIWKRGWKSYPNPILPSKKLLQKLPQVQSRKRRKIISWQLMRNIKISFFGVDSMSKSKFNSTRWTKQTLSDRDSSIVFFCKECGWCFCKTQSRKYH